MHRSSVLHILSVLSFLYDHAVAQSPTAPRWGQAASLLQNTLYVHGGRTDQFNEYAYTSAPVTNDLLTLDLSTSFDASSPPWKYIGGCSNCTAPQGPAIAWHTLSAFNTTDFLLFGGDPGPNSPIVLPEKADSAVLLGLDGGNYTWDYVPEGWAREPLRRIYHTASMSQGKVWIIGGLHADGSGHAFSQHFVFDPTTPSFTQLTASGGPPDIYGHASAVLDNGWLLVFGGYSPSLQSLVPMSTIWGLDTTQPSANWTTLPVAGGDIPPPRRGFATALLDKGRVLIHGGADAVLQTSLSDGWILDTTKNPMVWTSVPALTQLGPRRDHTAVAMGPSVLFAFGYANNGPVTPSLFVFDTASSSFQPSFSPPASGTTPPLNTLPGPSPTSGPGSGQPGSTGLPNPGNNDGNGDGGNPIPEDPSGRSDAIPIALGTVFGIIGLMLVTTGVAYYIRRRSRSQDSFHLLSPSDEEDSPHIGHAIPVAGVAMYEKSPPLRDRLVSLLPGRTAKTVPERRDMLADEDTRQFDTDWWAPGLRRNPSSARSSVKRPSLGGKVYDSLASLRTVGGAMIDYAANTTVMRNMRKEGSGGSRSMWTRSEKEPTDPFADDWGFVRSRRPTTSRQASTYTYHDPFEDYEVESIQFDYEAPPYVDSTDDEEKGYPRLNDPPPKPYLHSAFPPAVDLTRLSPVTERPSLSTLTESGATPSDSSHSNASPSIFGTAAPTATSNTSHDTPRSPTARPSSLIDANPSPNTPPSAPIRRSNSWWIRFAKTPLLDRRSSDASRHSHPLDFRDPNPPPTRLVPIEEASISPTDSKRNSSGGHHQVWSSHAHGRSASSLQTSRTANSEALERMGQMDVVQKGSHGTDKSSSGGEPAKVLRPLSVATTSSGSGLSIMDEENFVMSPDSMLDPSLPQSPTYVPPRKRSPTGAIAERVQEYERRMSQSQNQDEKPPRSPPPVRSRQRGSVYGVAPRASLYVANPDRERSGSS